MSVIIHTVNSASSQVNFQYLDSHHLFGLNVASTYSFDITDLEYDDGIAILTDVDAFDALRAAYLNKHFVAKIGTDIYRAGIITSLDLESGNQKNNRVATISIKEFKKVEDDGELSYLNSSIPSPQKLQRFSDTFSFSRQGADISYSRNVSLQYEEDVSEEFLNNAYIFIKNIYFTSRPSYGYQSDGLSEKAKFDNAFRPRLTEQYSLTKKSISFSENLSLSNVQGDYSRKISYAIENTEEGYREKRYTVEVVGLVDPVHHTALNGLKATIDEITDDNITEFGNPIALSKSIPKDGEKLTAQLTFSTDPSKNTEDAFSFSVSRVKNESFFDYSLNIELSSTSKDKNAEYEVVKNSWISKQVGISALITQYFPEATDIYLKSQSVNFNPYEAAITDTLVYTDNPDYNISGDTLKQKISVKTNNPTERFFEFSTPTGKARVQRQFPNQKNTLGAKSITVNLVKTKDVDLLVAEAEALALAEMPPDGTHWMVGRSSSLDPYNGTVSATISYNYFY